MRLFYRLFFLFAFATATITPQPAIAENITIVADQWCPFNCKPDDKYPGLLIEIAQAAFVPAGISISYSLLPWSRAVSEARIGMHTAVAGAYIDDAKGFVFPNNSQATSRNFFYLKRGATWKFQGIQSLEKISVGIIRDYSYTKPLDDYFSLNAKDASRVQIISGADGVEANIAKLHAGRIDAIVEDNLVMTFVLHKLGKENEIIGQDANASAKVYIAFSPEIAKSKEYADILSEAMVKLEQSGRLAEIYSHYGLTYSK